MKTPLLFIDNDKGGIIQIANIKGGVGKSTVATNVAACFARRGSTLLIDLDVQGSATVALGREPSELTHNSYNLFQKKYVGPLQEESELVGGTWRTKISGKLKQTVVNKLVHPVPVTSLVENVSPGLDLIGANSELYKPQNRMMLRNLMHNLRVCREYYKYIILDTPAVWNELIRQLYEESDLTLIPVTLNALSTKSLRDYVLHLKDLTEKNPYLKFRIVKNEVYGTSSSKAIGKVKTMMQNREFLKTLVDSIKVKGTKGELFVPQSLVIDLEIPESSVIRSAQDSGHSVFDTSRSSSARTAFNSLVRQIQRILNENSDDENKVPFWQYNAIPFFSRLAKVAAFLLVVNWSVMLTKDNVPVPTHLGGIEKTTTKPIHFQSRNGVPLYKVAKYAICQYRAIVPSRRQLDSYLTEVVAYHNRISQPTHRIRNASRIPQNLTLNFFPPSKIYNPDYEQDIQVFRYFMDLVDDPYPYITGLWADRGTGGGTPHTGIDVAAKLGSKVMSPVAGTAVLTYTKDGGRIVGVQFDNSILLFCHLKKRFVSNGQRIEAGQALGTIGMTGRTSGPHVHIGYGLAYPTGVRFGKKNYRMTDPKLWYYRQKVENQAGQDLVWSSSSSSS